MSAINGDKSRFNRERKQRIAKRIRNRKLVSTVSPESVALPPVSKPKPVSA
jgi:hypothetical protein